MTPGSTSISLRFNELRNDQHQLAHLPKGLQTGTTRTRSRKEKCPRHLARCQMSCRGCIQKPKMEAYLLAQKPEKRLPQRGEEWAMPIWVSYMYEVLKARAWSSRMQWRKGLVTNQATQPQSEITSGRAVCEQGPCGKYRYACFF